MDMPPYGKLLGLEPRREDGRLFFVMPASQGVVGRPGFLHGGAIAGLLEYTAFATLSEKVANPKVVMKPITVTVDFMRGGRMVDTRAEARIERLGRRIANVEVFAWQNGRDKPIASAQMNFLLERPART
ncbi:PaaI family thioesterase [Sphingomicrobium marinum]|uniref:PaaI family thioesterase n=1 Tax=Sphingomicrobium marinum TaxID=1227950 RepID=UPI002240733D|nr:PaaI family thioesterase [Sphingomicrobium marinum]